MVKCTCWVVDVVADICWHSKNKYVAELVCSCDAVVVQEARLGHEAGHLNKNGSVRRAASLEMLAVGNMGNSGLCALWPIL